MKKIIRIAGLAAVVAVTAVFASSRISTVESCEAAVDENFELLNQSYSMETLLNSSPYAYIDNPYYKNIVSLGFGAVEAMQEKNSNGEFSNLNSYIAAIAIQEITGCDLYGITGVDFETADEFYDLWNKAIADMPEMLSDIIGNRSITAGEKVEELKKYGVFGEAAAYAVSGSSAVREQFLDGSVDDLLSDSEKQIIKNMVKSDTDELRKAVDYLCKYHE